MYHDIGIDLDNFASFLINEKSQDSFSINVLNQINIDDEITIIVERNGLRVEEVESGIHFISSNLPVPILCQDNNSRAKTIIPCQDNNSINTEKNLEQVDITSNPISHISDPIDFTIDDSVGVVSDRKNERTNSKSTDDNSNIENPLDTYRCSASETVLVNTSCENEFISIAPIENVRPESLTNDIFFEELSHPHLLLNYTLKISSDSDYIFFTHSVIQKLNLSNQINIAMRKIISSQLKAGTFSSNFNEKVKSSLLPAIKLLLL